MHNSRVNLFFKGENLRVLFFKGENLRVSVCQYDPIFLVPKPSDDISMFGYGKVKNLSVFIPLRIDNS